MPTTVEINIPQNFGTEVLDHFQTQVEEYIITQWQRSVSGQSVIGAQINDKQYIQEIAGTRSDLMQRGMLVRNNSVFVRESIFRGGPIAQRYENGVLPYDLKPFLLAGQHTKIGKSGPYNTVPFRHGIPRKQGLGGHFDQMTKTIHKLVQQPHTDTSQWTKSTPYIVTSSKTKRGATVFKSQDAGFKAHTLKDLLSKGGEYSKGHRLTGTDDYYRKTKKLRIPQQGNRLLEYTWKSGKFEGMIKLQKTYKEGVQNTYLTFRRVSLKSDPDSWWHPGFKQIRILEKLAHYTETQLKLLWQEYLEQYELNF